jgi:uncharacterized protein YutE (UPF0331/DUF86 family)
MSIERILRLLIENVYGEKIIGEKIIKDDSWHKRLIEAGSQKGILPEEIESTLQEMRRFRHLLTHGYGVEMDEDEFRKNIPEAIKAYFSVENHIVEIFPELRRPHNDS